MTSITGFVMAASLALLSGCADLGPIRDYVSAAEPVLADTGPAARWRDSERRLIQLRLDGDTCPIGRPGRKPQANFDAAFAQAAAVHETLAAYFTALGRLATDAAPEPRPAGNASLAALGSAGVPVKTSDEKAFKALADVLARVLEAYRREKVRELMDETHHDVDRLIDLLQRLAAVYTDELEGERTQAIVFLECSLATGDLGDKFLARRELRRQDEAYRVQLDALRTYSAALARICRDHEAIRHALTFDRSALVPALRELADTAKSLETARAALSKI